MSKKLDGPSEVSINEIWREAIRREDNGLRNQKKVYSCNLKALKKDQITEAPGCRGERKRELTQEEDEMATKILNDYGIKTKAADPTKIHVPYTSNAQYGNYNHFRNEDGPRSECVKRMCEETKYAQSYYSMTGKSAYSK